MICIYSQLLLFCIEHTLKLRTMHVPKSSKIVVSKESGTSPVENMYHRQSVLNFRRFSPRLSELEEAQRRLARFDWELEQQRAGLQRCVSNGHGHGCLDDESLF